MIYQVYLIDGEILRTLDTTMTEMKKIHIDSINLEDLPLLDFNTYSTSVMSTSQLIM